MAGTMFLVVGPSGAGKDTLLDGARAALANDARYVFAPICWLDDLGFRHGLCLQR